MPADRPYFAPRFELRIGGHSLSPDVSSQVTSVSYESNLDMADMFQFVLYNQNHRFTDSDLFEIGQRVELYMGYGANLQPMTLGEIASVQPTFPQSGVPTLNVRGYDLSYRLRQNSPTRPPFKAVTDSQIAEAIARDAQLKAEVDPTSLVHEHLLQTEADLPFLQRRADFNQFDAYVRWDKLFFKKRATQAQGYLLEWGNTLSSFTPRIGNRGRADTQVVYGYNEHQAQVVVGRQKISALPDSKQKLTEGLKKSLQAGGEDVRMVPGIRSAADAQAQAQAQAQAGLDSMREGSGTCIGIPDLRSGDIVVLDGLGKRFSGPYRLTSISHSIDEGGYQCSFEVARPGGGSALQTLRETLDSPGRREQRVPGVLSGVVVRNVDPQGLGRVQVQLHYMKDRGECVWARCLTPMAGGGAGVYFRPDVGDEVTLSFEQGDLNRPLVIGGVWNGGAKPPVGQDPDNRLRMLRTKAGLAVMLDDTPGAEQVRIEDKNGNFILLDAAKGDVLIKAKNKITLAADSVDVKVTKDITMNADKIEVNVQTEMNVQ